MFGTFAGIAIFIVFAVVIGSAIMLFMQRDRKDYGFKTIFSTYFYLVSIISLLAAFFGLASITKAIASDVFGRDFSYYNYAASMSEPSIKTLPGVEESSDSAQIAAESKQREKARIESQYQEDLFNGISMLVVGLLFLGVHILGWQRLESAAERSKSFLYKGYIVVQLATFSIITLIALPLGISQSLRYALGQSSPENTILPGEPTSVALWATPIWLVFIWLTIKTMRQQQVR